MKDFAIKIVDSNSLDIVEELTERGIEHDFIGNATNGSYYYKVGNNIPSCGKAPKGVTKYTLEEFINSFNKLKFFI